MEKKIGPLLLSGLMIGPILGSGVILLPPLAYGKLGAGTLWAWIIIMGLGAIFALIFSRLSVLFPGDGGMTIAIDKVLGKKLKICASLLMMTAVMFGPTAVMLTAAEYLKKLDIFSGFSLHIISMGLIVIAYIVLMKDIKFISTLSFILSSTIAVILVVSSIAVIITRPIAIGSITAVEPIALGKVVLLLFWAIIGWEIVGNYSDQVKDLQRTIPRATYISIGIITVTYILIALAIQSFEYTQGLSLVNILMVVFGSSSKWILALLVTGLCFCTYLLIVGAIARLMSSLGVEGYLPSKLGKKTKSDIPHIAITYYIAVHLIVLALVGSGIINIEGIVAIANAFFLANAIIGLVAAIKLIDTIGYRIGAIVLIVSFLVILAMSPPKIFIALLIVYLIGLYICKRNNKEVEMEKELAG